MPLKPEYDLRGHQDHAVETALKRNGNIIFSHPVGSGKTLTSIATFEKMKEQGLAKRALVVTPAGLRSNYGENGVHKFTDSTFKIYGNKQEIGSDNTGVYAEPHDHGPEYGVVSYELFRENPEKYIKGHNADTVIFDEFHRVKNDESLTFKALRGSRHLFRNFIGMTGSIASNTPADVIPLIDAMTDGKHSLGSKASFENRFVNVDSEGNKTVTNKILVRALLAPYVHHVTDEQVHSGALKPPKKVINEIEVNLEGPHEEYYRYVIDQLDPVTKAKLKAGVGKLSKSQMDAMFAKLLKSRQVANAMHMLDNTMSLDESAEKSVKVKRLLDDVQKHMDHTSDAQVVIHSELLQGGLDVIEAGLKKRGLEYGKFIGKGNAGVTEKARQQDVADYNSGKKKIILISSAGGEGIDLPNTTMVASLDGHYNPEKINQVEARGIRMGGLSHREEKDRRVIVNRYISKLNPSKIEIANNTLDLVNPVAGIKRLFNGQKVFFNPMQASPTVDQLMYTIAKQKAHGNEELKGLFEKTSEFSINSDKIILEDYMTRFGDQLATGDYADGGWIDQAQENRYLAQLKRYYAGAKRKDSIKIAPKDLDKYKDRTPLKHALIEGGKVGGLTMLLTAAASPHLTLGALKQPSLRLPAASILGLAGLIGGGFTAYQQNKPHYTTSPADAKKRLQLDDADLLRILRGEAVRKEEVKVKDHFIRMK